jgi:hypothetical protein
MGSPSPSVPPRGVTWPMVAYALVRELPNSLSVIGGVIVAIVLILRSSSSVLEPLAAAILPGVISALARSRPVEPLDVARLTGAP